MTVYSVPTGAFSIRYSPFVKSAYVTVVSVVPSLILKVSVLRFAPLGTPLNVFLIFKLPRSCVYVFVRAISAT